MNNIENYNAHVLALPYPSQGHINPMLQFSRRLSSKGVKITFAITKFIYKTVNPTSDGHLHFDTISDGYDKGGFFETESVDAYVAQLEVVGSKSLSDLILNYSTTTNPITCVVYDSFLPWGLEVAKKFNLLGAAFFTQACAVDYIYYLIYHGKLTMPITSWPVVVHGLPPLDACDLPSFVGVPGSYPAYTNLVVNQNCNIDKADFVLVNTFYELEHEVVDAMSTQCSSLLTIGPTVPSFYLDKQVEYDKDYNLNLFHLDNTTIITNWLSTKPHNSVVYVSFGSMCSLPKPQMEELAMGLNTSGFYFLWVVRESEETKLPHDFAKMVGEKGMVVRWIPQLQVLANEALGCFLTHCGWNSTLEALVLGVPMIGMPQWTDQPTDSKFIKDVWKVGIRVKGDENGIVGREEIVACIKEMMVGTRREELKCNAKKWKELAIKAVSQGGSSDKNIDELVSNIKLI